MKTWGPGASEGQCQQWIHYANSMSLCLTSNNSALYICKGWQDTVHTGPLSEHCHARMVTPDGWPLSAVRRLGHTFLFNQTDTQTQLIKWSTQLIRWGTRHISEVKHGTMWRKFKKNTCSDFQKTSQKKTNLMLRTGNPRNLFIPAEVKNTLLALLNFLSQRPPLKIWR